MGRKVGIKGAFKPPTHYFLKEENNNKGFRIQYIKSFWYGQIKMICSIIKMTKNSKKSPFALLEHMYIFPWIGGTDHF